MARWVLASCCVAWALVSSAAHAAASDWRPQKNVEIIVGAAPGGPLDSTARMLQMFMQQQKELSGVPVLVMSKPGGSYSIGWNYINRFAGDAHYVAMALPNLVTNPIMGEHDMTYADVTPLALLSSEYLGFSMRADSPITSAKALLDRLRADPESLTIAITNFGSASHIAAAMVLNAAGVDVTRVRYIPHKGATDTTAAVIGGHVDLLIATPTGTWPHIQSGRLRMLAVTAPQRLPGKAAIVPTWKELGIDAVFGNWRMLVGPQGMTAPQIAYWNDLLRRFTQSPEWRKGLEVNGWGDEYLNSADTMKFLKAESARLTPLLRSAGALK